MEISSSRSTSPRAAAAYRAANGGSLPMLAATNSSSPSMETLVPESGSSTETPYTPSYSPIISSSSSSNVSASKPGASSGSSSNTGDSPNSPAAGPPASSSGSASATTDRAASSLCSRGRLPVRNSTNHAESTAKKTRNHWRAPRCRPLLRARSRSTLLSESSLSFSGSYNRTAGNHLRVQCQSHKATLTTTRALQERQ